MGSKERARGILSPEDREYILDPEKWSENKTASEIDQRKKAITNRLRNAILDFEYLSHENLPQPILDSAFQCPDDFDPKKDGPISLRQAGGIDVGGKDPSIERGFTAAVTLIYRTFSTYVASEIVEKGVINATSVFYPNHEIVDASYDPTLRPVEGVHERAKKALEEGSILSNAQVLLLLKEGEVDPDDVAENVQQHSGPVNSSNKTMFKQTREKRIERLSREVKPDDAAEDCD